MLKITRIRMSTKYNVIFYGTDFFARACLERIHKHPNIKLLGAVVAEKAKKCEVKSYRNLSIK